MVWKLECPCKERTATEIDSFVRFQEIKDFFEEQAEKGIFLEEVPLKPFYTWEQQDACRKWFATKWYKCKVCGCLWEFNYPDFPANGFVRKFPNGIYQERGF